MALAVATMRSNSSAFTASKRACSFASSSATCRNRSFSAASEAAAMAAAAALSSAFFAARCSACSLLAKYFVRSTLSSKRLDPLTVDLTSTTLLSCLIMRRSTCSNCCDISSRAVVS